MASLLEGLREILAGEFQNKPQVQKLMRDVSGGNPGQFMAQVDMLRGAREGSPDPRLQTLQTPTEQALADRYAWGADIAAQKPLAGALALLPAMAYEGVKAAAPGSLGWLGRALPQGQEMAVNSRTSPASMENIKALIAGYRSR
jgi:hypothetical protein